MNREQKIALIIGFAVVLVVGVLVSDHWSGARQLRIADATEGDSGRVESGPVAVLPDPGGMETRLTAGTPGGTSDEVEARAEGRSPLETVTTIALGGNGRGSPLGDALQAASDSREQPEQPRRAELWRSQFREVGARVAEGLSAGLPAAAGLESPADRAVVPTPRARVVEPPVDRPIRHTVKRNESLYKIAATYLGDGNRWREIADANRDKVGTDGGVRTGVTLLIPNAAGVSAPAPQLTPESRPAERRVAETPVLSKPITYTVAKNDSLGEISQRFLGSSRRVNDIVRANPGKIDDPDDIRVGMVLTIPARS